MTSEESRSEPAGAGTRTIAVRRAAVITLATVSVWIVVGLWVDAQVGELGQTLLGILTAAVLAGLLTLQPAAVRWQTLGVGARRAHRPADDRRCGRDRLRVPGRRPAVDAPARVRRGLPRRRGAGAVRDRARHLDVGLDGAGARARAREPAERRR